jgi:transcriptional regulator with XRE-family HTH domain
VQSIDNTISSPLRDCLIGILHERTSRNSSYSIRALARDLGISHTTLRKVIAGETILSFGRTKQIASRLKLFDSDVKRLLHGTRLLLESDPVLRHALDPAQTAAGPVLGPVQLQARDFDGIPLFNVVQVLEAFEVCDPAQQDLTSTELAELTKLPASTLHQITGRLCALSVIKSDPARDSYTRIVPRWEISSRDHSVPLKTVHLEALERIKREVTLQLPGERYSATEFISIPDDRQSELMELCHDFIEKLHQLAELDRRGGRVVHLVALHTIRWMKR